MQIAEVRKMITDIYNVLTYCSEYAFIEKYMLTEEVIHDEFWKLHKDLTIAKGDLRIAVNHVSEASETVEAAIQNIRNLITRDKENKKRKNMTAKIEVVVVEGKL